MRVGVILCTCGKTLTEKIDFDELKKFAEGLDGVEVVEVTDDLCQKTEEKLSNFDVDGFIFGCCSEKNSLTFSEERIYAVLKSVGVNPSLFEVVNLREQCVWIHDGDLTGKAKDQLKMAYVKLKTNLEAYKYKPKEKVLIIGGGVTGLSCALSLNDLGVDFLLIERDHYLGGKAIQTFRVWQSEGYPSSCTTACSVLHLVKNAWYECREKILTNSEVLEIKKENGNFKAKILKRARYVDVDRCIGCGKCSEVCPISCENPFNFGFTSRKALDKDYKTAVPDVYYILDCCNRCGECVEVCPTKAIDLNAKDEVFEEEFGAVVIATGFEEKKIEIGDKVVTFMQLERLIENKMIPKSVIFVMCRDQEYCSRLCCPIAIKLSNILAGVCDVTVIYEEFKSYGRAFEEFRKQAVKKGVKFVRAKVEEVKNGVVVTDKGEFKADLIALAEGFVPAELRIVNELGVVTDKYGYPIEFQPRVVNPLETHVERVFVAGCAKGFKDIQESVESGHAVANKVYRALKGMEKKFYSLTDVDRCSKCGLCEAVCPHGAIVFRDDFYRIEPELCRGCGLCYATCPSKAIRLINMEDYQILKMSEVAFENCDGRRVLALLCYWCSYTACDKMGLNGLKVPSNVRTIRVRCSASVNPETVLEILEKNLADYVLVAGCPPKNCHHLWGNYMENNRFKLLNKIIKELGLEERCRYEYIGVSAWAKLQQILKELCG